MDKLSLKPKLRAVGAKAKQELTVTSKTCLPIMGTLVLDRLQQVEDIKHQEEVNNHKELNNIHHRDLLNFNTHMDKEDPMDLEDPMDQEDLVDQEDQAGLEDLEDLVMNLHFHLKDLNKYWRGDKPIFIVTSQNCMNGQLSRGKSKQSSSPGLRKS